MKTKPVPKPRMTQYMKDVLHVIIQDGGTAAYDALQYKAIEASERLQQRGFVSISRSGRRVDVTISDPARKYMEKQVANGWQPSPDKY